MTNDLPDPNNSLDALLELNQKISHNLQIISLLANNIQVLSDENLVLLNKQAEEVVAHYSNFRKIFYSILELNKEATSSTSVHW